MVVPENRESLFKNKKKSPFSQPWWRIPAIPALEKLRQEDGCEVNTYVGYCLKTFYIKKNKSRDSVVTLPGSADNAPSGLL